MLLSGQVLAQYPPFSDESLAIPPTYQMQSTSAMSSGNYLVPMAEISEPFQQASAAPRRKAGPGGGYTGDGEQQPTLPVGDAVPCLVLLASITLIIRIHKQRTI